MSYIVLARKYRPQTFDEIIGQSHITDIFKKAVTNKRLAHAFLFCGPRGIGKTSCARIVAKSLNCKNAPTTKPCGTCPACLEIAKGNSFDVIEIDGASNRGIDEIRALRENVKFAPSYGQYKIYIVDEVHMLTTEAFNALLKTIEEPPPHVKFILATTAPHKVPATIISRCQRFDFKRISLAGIAKALKNICKDEKFRIDDGALYVIAKAAQGSLRDALSILDQLSALSERNIEVKDVYTMLGMVEVDLLFELTGHLSKGDCARALETLDKVIDQGKDLKQLTRDLTEHFRHLMVIKVGGKALGKLVEYPVAVKEQLLTQTKSFTLKEILDSIEIFVKAQEMARLMDSLRMPIELAFAKIVCAKNPSGPLPKEKTKTPGASALPKGIEVLANKKGHVQFGKGDDALEVSPAKEDSKEDLTLGVAREENLTPEELTIERVCKSWDAITYAISKKKMSVATFLQEGAPYKVQGSKIIISFPKDAAFHKETLEEKQNRKLIQNIFTEKLKTNILVDFTIMDNHKPNEEETLIKAAVDTFKGKVVNKWNREA